MKILFYFSRGIIKERYRRITTPRNECNTNVIYTRISIKMRIGRAYRIISPGHLFITLSRMRESFFSQNKHKSNKNRIASSYLDPPVWEKYPTDMCSRIELKLIWERTLWSEIGKRNEKSRATFLFYLECHFLINLLVELRYERQSKPPFKLQSWKNSSQRPFLSN